MSNRVRWRVVWVVAFLVVLFTVISVRLVSLQVGRHEEFLRYAVTNHAMEVTLYARRGDILDCNGNVLATSVPLKNVYADLIKMREVLQKQGKKKKVQKECLSVGEIALQIAPLLSMSQQEVAAKLSLPKGRVDLKKKVDMASWNKIKAMNLPGIESEETFVRHYPEGHNVAHVVGYVDHNEVGREGVERSFEQELKGIDGCYISERDRKGGELRIYRSQNLPARNGHNVVLTIDQTIQHIVEEELDRAVLEYQPKGASTIVMRVKSGEILAMANRPTYDPNNRGHLDWDSMRNRCITDTFEPGSTFKTITIAAALNENVCTLETPIFCENGSYTFGGKVLHDSSPHGALSVGQVYQKSSNIGFAKIGQKIGDAGLYSYIRKFGFGKTVLNGVLPGEQAGTLRPVKRWSKISITRIPMGHEVAATPLQMVTAVNAVANGGGLMRPMLVKAIVDDNGKKWSEYNPRQLGQIIRRDVAQDVTQAMVSVVSSDGTAEKAKVPGFTVAGKTGTANKWDQETHSYSKKRYLASFIGFLPAEDPQFVVLTMIDEPSGKKFYGGQVAAPIFAAMASRIVKHLDIAPREDIMEVALR